MHFVILVSCLAYAVSDAVTWFMRLIVVPDI